MAANTSLTIPAILRLLEVSLHLFAVFFPEQIQVEDNAQYDIIIVGAGSAGCVLAGRLSEDENVSVLLIEAGDNPTLEVMLPGLTLWNQRSKFDWNDTTVNDGNAFQCHKDGVFPAARGHGLGGSSAINFMYYVRGDPNDYNRWAKITNCSDWDYEHVLPYFIKSEKMEDPHILNSSHKRFHGTEGPMRVSVYPDLHQVKYLNAFQEIGYEAVLDSNGNYTLGFSFPTYTASQGLRQSTCFCFVSPIKHRKNLHVLKNTKVNKVIIKDNVAIGVEVVTMGNERKTIKANLEVILSAGAFKSPQLLMLSGIGPQEHLESFNIRTLQNLPVGYNLLDHICTLMFHETEKLDSAFKVDPLRPEAPMLNGFVALNKSQRYPDTQFIMLSTKSSEAFYKLMSQFDDDINRKAMNIKTREVLMGFITNLIPASRGRVMLSSANPDDKPQIHLRANYDKLDVKNMIRFVKEYLRIENSTYFKSVNATRLDMSGDRCKGFTPGSNDYWECYVRCFMFSIWHYSGTCAMGTVVDARLRVFGIRKLRVVDASVFPTIPSGNTNAPTIMTAEKAADMIKEDNRMRVVRNNGSN